MGTTTTVQAISSHEDRDDTLSPSCLFGDLALLKVRFCMTMDGGATSSNYQGSAWRGLIGWGLRKAACRNPGKHDCGTCPHRESCAYFVLFEMKTNLPGLSESPRGYVVYAPPCAQDRRQFLDVTLFGRCTEFLPLVLRSLILGRKEGIGAQRQRYEIEHVARQMPGGRCEPLPVQPSLEGNATEGIPLRLWLEEDRPKGNQLCLRFTTPLRLRRYGAYLNGMDWPFFLESLARRLEALHAVHGVGGVLGGERWRRLKEDLARVCVAESELRWFEYGRYSNRQRRKVPMGGLAGRALASAVSPFWREWWLAASLVHVGKGASMGLGRVDILQQEE